MRSFLYDELYFAVRNIIIQQYKEVVNNVKIELFLFSIEFSFRVVFLPLLLSL